MARIRDDRRARRPQNGARGRSRQRADKAPCSIASEGMQCLRSPSHSLNRDRLRGRTGYGALCEPCFVTPFTSPTVSLIDGGDPGVDGGVLSQLNPCGFAVGNRLILLVR